MGKTEDKKYKKVMSKKELDKENDIFMSDKTSYEEQSKILNQKVKRIEKTVYIIELGVGILLILEILRLSLSLWSGIFV